MTSQRENADANVAATFAEVARLLLAQEGVERTLSKISLLAVKTIDGCDHAGVTLIEGRKVTTAGASDEVPGLVDAIQYETGQGPCLDAIRDHGIFRTDDLAEETRWPQFAARAAAETGVASMMAFRLFVEEETMGALNLFSRQAGAFDDEARDVGSVFAAHAAVALSAARTRQQLEEALESRDVIGQAKGILMARQDLTSDQAFDALRRASQRLNVKLREVAGEVVSTGDRVVEQPVPPRSPQP